MTPAITRAIEDALAARIAQISPIGTGFGVQGYKVTFQDGRRAAVKAQAPDAPCAHLALQARMLQDLHREPGFPVPEIYHADDDLLIMAWIDNDAGALTAEAECHAARLLAALHQTPRDSFGYPYDTLIGPLPQPNPQTPKWVPFFRDHRLLYMARLAHEQGALPASLLHRLEALGADLETHLLEPPHPSLIHGDVWGGNVLVKEGRIAAFIDPACYHAHAEVELAFTAMFSTFGERFLSAYEEIRPLEPGFRELRRDIYNLYPALVHVRLFGQSYLAGIEQTLKSLGF